MRISNTFTLGQKPCKLHMRLCNSPTGVPRQGLLWIHLKLWARLFCLVCSFTTILIHYYCSGQWVLSPSSLPASPCPSFMAPPSLWTLSPCQSPSCPSIFLSVCLQSLHLTIVSGQTAQFGLFVSHNCIQSLSYMFQIDVSNGICLLYSTSIFLEFCHVLKHKCNLDRSNGEFYKLNTQMDQEVVQISLH